MSRAQYLPVATAFVLALAPAAASIAQSDPCDPRLQPPANDPLGYQLRPGGRCEGRYVLEVASVTLELASFTSSFASYDPRSIAGLTLGWPEPFAAGEVHLRARGLRPRLYYRMDAPIDGAARPFDWPADVISRLAISPGDLGVVGWIRAEVGGEPRDVYLPLDVRADGDGGGEPGTYRLVLVPGQELAEIQVSVAPLDDNGRLGSFLYEGVALGYGYYPAERGTAFTLTGLGDPGLYYLEVGATLEGGGAVTLEILFQHSG